MKKIYTILAVLMLTAGHTAWCQATFGIEGGFNLATISQNFEESDDESELSFRGAFKLGAFAELPMSDQFAIRPGLYLNSKGTSFDLEENFELPDGIEIDGFSRLVINYLEIPVNAVYKISDLELFFGPYVAFGIGGTLNDDFEVTDGTVTETIDEETDLEFTNEIDEDSDEDKTQLRGLDVGFQLGVSYNIGSILLSASFSKGLTNITPDRANSDFDPADQRTTNTVVGLSVGYKFGQ